MAENVNPHRTQDDNSRRRNYEENHPPKNVAASNFLLPIDPKWQKVFQSFAGDETTTFFSRPPRATLGEISNVASSGTGLKQNIMWNSAGSSQPQIDTKNNFSYLNGKTFKLFGDPGINSSFSAISAIDINSCFSSKNAEPADAPLNLSSGFSFNTSKDKLTETSKFTLSQSDGSRFEHAIQNHQSYGYADSIISASFNKKSNFSVYSDSGYGSNVSGVTEIRTQISENSLLYRSDLPLNPGTAAENIRSKPRIPLSDISASFIPNDCEYEVSESEVELSDADDMYIIPPKNKKQKHPQSDKDDDWKFNSMEMDNIPFSPIPYVKDLSSPDDATSHQPRFSKFSSMKSEVSLNSSLNSSFNDAFAQNLDFGNVREHSVLPSSLPPCPLYSLDNLNYWNKTQRNFLPRANYMDKQTDVTHKMRTILVDWLMEVCTEFELQDNIPFLAINYVDRFLSRMSVSRSKLQLVGTAALLIAAKFDEVEPPEIKDFVYITDGTYSKKQVVKMEKVILTGLDFHLMAPTILDYIKLYCFLLRLDNRTGFLATYLAQLTLLEGETYINMLPSMIGTACVSLARETYEKVFWDETMADLSTHDEEDIQDCAKKLYFSFYMAPLANLRSAFEKYKSSYYDEVSVVTLPVRFAGTNNRFSV